MRIVLCLYGNLIKKWNSGYEHSSCFCVKLVKKWNRFPPLYLSQVLRLVFEASFHSPLKLDEKKLGGHLLSTSRLHVEFRAASFLSWGLSTNHPFIMR